MALSKPRKIVRRDGRTFLLPVAASAAIIQSGLVILAAGYARAARAGQGGDDAAKQADAATYRAAGIALESVTGGASDGDVKVNVETGTFNFKNSAGANAVSLADLGEPCFIVDDETVARTSANATRAQAGIVRDVDSEGVWVEVGSRESGLRQVVLPFFINQTDLLAGTAAELISPVAGEISRLSTTVQVAVTTGGAVTAKVGTTDVDGLSITVADGATKGTVQSDTPTAGHASTLVAVGSRIQVVPAAAFDTAGAISGHVVITY